MLKLNYFNGRGMGETARLIMVAANETYEDFRYPLKIIDWATHSMERPEFDADQSSGKLWKSMGKVPFLNVGDDTVISQSKAIERYLAGRFDMMGSSPEEAALIDSYCEYIRDFKTAYQGAKRKEDRETSLAEWFTITLPSKLKEFDMLLTRNTDFQDIPETIILSNKRFAVGGKLSLADIVIYSFLSDFFDNKEGVSDACSTCPTLNNIVRTVGENEYVKKWVETREQTDF